MKLKQIGFFFAATMLFVACKKTETIVQEYNPPQPTLFGKWKLLPQNPSDSSLQFWIFNDDGSNFVDLLIQDQYGFRNKPNSYVFHATDKQLMVASQIWNYIVSNDTLFLRSNKSTPPIIFIKETDPGINVEDFLKNAGITKSALAPIHVGTLERSFGIKSNDTLYFCNSINKIRAYKFAFSAQTLVDSLTNGEFAAMVRTPTGVYFGWSGNYQTYKYNDNLKLGGINSTNKLTDVLAMSFNGSTNTIYAYQSDDKLFSGSDAGTLSLLKDLSNVNPQMVVYFNSDIFFMLKNNLIYKTKIFPVFQVLDSYVLPSHLQPTALGSDGSSIWAHVTDSNDGKNKFVQLSLP